MASVAKYRDDLTGSIATTGTSTAYAATSNQGLALAAGAMIAFVPHTTSGNTVTLNVDSLGAKPLRSAPGVEIIAGFLVQGTPYAATYYTTNSGEWILHGFYGNPYSIPLGGMMPYAGAAAPNSSFVLPFGQAISRTTYASLFSLCATNFGAGNGSTTFNVPDLRGRIPVGLDTMGGSAASRVTSGASGVDGASIGASGGEQVHTLTAAESASLTYTSTVTDPGHFHDESGGTGRTSDTAVDIGFSVGGSRAADRTATATTGITVATSSNAGGSSHNNMQPSLVVPWIMRVI